VKFSRAPAFYNTGTTWTLRVSQSVDLGNNTLVNVAASGNEWVATGITLTHTGASKITVATTGSGNEGMFEASIPAAGTGNPGLQLVQGDGNGNPDHMKYAINYVAGSDYLRLRSWDTDGNSANADIWRVPDGQTTIDANTTWDINVFDDYDDAAMLSPYRDGVLNLTKRREELIEMGVLKRYPDGWVGHNDQRMEALLAGGIYQNRARLDAQYEALNRRLEAIGA